MTSESTLIEQSLAGDSDAFGNLVREYQSLVCAITYSLCGNAARSQEIAQEAFVNAWRDLGTLKDRSKFKSWLCGIARNLARNAYRAESRKATGHADPIGDADELPSQDLEPDDQAMADDESALVWDALAQLPENYHEPLVLFYREDQSVRDVADALELSEDAVKQRLSVGRTLLKDKVHTLKEGVLVRTRPGPAFTIAVLTVLPAMTPTTATATAAVTATATKGSAAAKSVIASGWLGMILGPIIGALGAWFGVHMALKNAKSDTERQEIIKMTKLTCILVGIFLVTMFGILIFGRTYLDQRTFILALVALPLVYSAALVALIITGNRRLNRLQAEASSSANEGVRVMSTSPREYKSDRTFLGLPLIHMATGGIVDGKPVKQIAKGWIAFGDIALSPFIAIGSIAFGTLSFGGVTCGLISIGGLALGGLAFAGVAVGGIAIGGVAIGWWALGGAALAWQAALGGAALAREYAFGGAAIAHEANTEAARAWFESNEFFQSAQSYMKPNLSIYLCPIILIICFVGQRIAQRMMPPQVEQRVPFTGGWIMECPKCSYAKPLPGVRIAASSYQKRTLGYCPQCKRLRFIAIRHVG